MLKAPDLERNFMKAEENLACVRAIKAMSGSASPGLGREAGRGRSLFERGRTD